MGPGLDGLEGKLMKWAAHVLMYPIADLLNLSVSTGEIPHVWKHARVTPLHKGGNSLDPNINRPISIICIIAKVLKVNTVYFNYLREYDILSSYQSCFRPNHSTTNAL